MSVHENGEMMRKKSVEVLAPAGSYESMTAAYAAGADAVYIGGSRFGARAYADNLDQGGMCRAIDYAHLHGRRLYMTVNTLFKEQELGELIPYLTPYYERGLDGVIVQDLGVLARLRSCFPDLPLHVSTQMTITGVYGARKLKELGASRIVTARELSLEEIRQIRRQVDIEIESFVHGALCYCYSGQCLMSSMIGGRSGNRGRCAQPCRLPYEVRENGKRLDGVGDGFVLNLKDLCTLELIPDLLEAGIDSLKIEGRMKSPRYTAGVVSIYRKYVDQYLEYGRKGYQVKEEDKKLLLDLFDRGGFTKGYYGNHNGREMIALKEKPSFRQGNPEYFRQLDEAYVNHVAKEPIKGRAVLRPGEAASLTLWLGDITVTVKGQVVEKAMNQPIEEERVRKQLQKTGNTPFVFASLELEMEAGSFLPMQALNALRRQGMEKLEEAALSQYFRSRGRRVSDETGGREPVSEVERGRKQAPGVAAGWESVSEVERDRKQAPGAAGGHGSAPDAAKIQDAADKMQAPSGQPLFVVSLEEPEQLPPALEHPDVDEIYVDADGFLPSDWSETAAACHRAGKCCRLMLPHIFRMEEDQYFRKNWAMLKVAGFDGVVVRSLEECQWLKEMEGEDQREDRLSMVFDASIYGWNHLADEALYEAGALRITMPVELNSRELREKGCRGQEILIYGAVPMMVSAQCLTKTVKGCRKHRGCLTMKDRTGKEMPVKNHCTFCYNTIYNASPTSLLGQEKLVLGLSPSALRLGFTTETPGRIAWCLKAFADSFLHGQPSSGFVGDFTRGHIKRGVQ